MLEGLAVLCVGAPCVLKCPKGRTFASVVNYTVNKKSQRRDVARQWNVLQHLFLAHRGCVGIAI
jgi:hypothetical protein